MAGPDYDYYETYKTLNYEEVKEAETRKTEKKEKTKKGGAKLEESRSIISLSIKTSDLSLFLRERLSLLEHEYASIPGKAPWSQNTAGYEQHKHKHREYMYRTYDVTRVKLKPIAGDQHSDYINASYIKGMSGKLDRLPRYIACQAPRQHTVIDMWRMIWQKKCNLIVMLINRKINGKTACREYWSTPGKMFVDKYSVELTGLEERTSYVYRRFTMCKGNRSRFIHHMQYTGWNKDSTPKSLHEFLMFYTAVKSMQESVRSVGPLVVHCGSGSGRTATFIALDLLMKQAATEKRVDVIKCVHHLRKYRPYMVNTYTQYLTLYRLLQEAFLHGKGWYSALRTQTAVRKHTYTGLKPGEADTTPALSPPSLPSTHIAELTYNDTSVRSTDSTGSGATAATALYDEVKEWEISSNSSEDENHALFTTTTTSRHSTTSSSNASDGSRQSRFVTTLTAAVAATKLENFEKQEDNFSSKA